MTKSTLLVPYHRSSAVQAGARRVPVEVRRIAHAKRVRLSYRPERGFLLTCPPGTSRAVIGEVLDRAEPWARRVLERHARIDTPILPGTLHLPARDESFSIDYTAGRSGIAPGHLRVAARGDPTTALRLLRGQLRALAEQTFVPRIEALAEQHGLVVTAVRCGLQRTRWGSCSAQGGIRLNSVLLFVAPALADHVLLHELAHTRHMDHSPTFRALLARLDPAYLAHERGLREAWRDLPGWWWRGGALPAAGSPTAAADQA